MSDTQSEKSPAEEFFLGQQRSRAGTRKEFQNDAGDFIAAHEFIVSAIAMCLKRFGGKKWPDTLHSETGEKTAQVAQLTMLFIHGIDLCESAIAEGLYGQGAALLRQQMEIIGAMDEVWKGTRIPKIAPKVSSLSKELRQQYGGLSELTHAAVPESLQQMFTDIRGDFVGAAITPLYQKDLAIFLYRLELSLLFALVERQETALGAAYGEAYNKEEMKMIRLAVAAANHASNVLDKLPSEV